MDTLGERLRSARENLNFSQTYVAKELGLNNKLLSNYERNINSPDPDILKQLCIFYNVSSDFILGIGLVKGDDIEGLSLSDELKRVIHYYNRLSEENQDLIRGTMVQLYKEQEKEAGTSSQQIS